MEYSKQNRLETFVERHRADFDLHEPRPDLWAALEQQLHGEATPTPEPVMSVVPDEETLETGRQLQFEIPAQATAPIKRWRWSEPYSLAAALVVLLLPPGWAKPGSQAAWPPSVGWLASCPPSLPLAAPTQRCTYRPQAS